MEYKITALGNIARPSVELPDPKILEEIKEEGMRALIDEHYELLIKSSIKDLFPFDKKILELAKKHAADFFIQICAGPRYFDESRGAPMMARRHAPFKITLEARIIWLETFAQALDKTAASEEVKKSFWKYLDIFSIWMINTASEVKPAKFSL